jgi:hypothetical protein
MPTIPFPQGFNGIKEFPRLKETLINILNVGGNKLYQRPGIDPFTNTGFGPCRGQAKFNNELYQVSGQKFIKINEDGTIRDISTEFAIDIEGFGDDEFAPVVFAEGYTHLVFVVKGGEGYAWDGVTFDAIGTNYLPSVDVDYMDGRYIFIPADGSPAFFSDPFDPFTIDPLAFFDAETQPDLNTGILNFKQRLYIMGEETIEVFRSTGQPVTPQNPVPYRRIDGASIWTGLVSGHTLFGPSFAFLGKDKDNNYGFFLMGSGNAQRISNPAVDELINTFYTVDQLRECTAHRLQWKNQDVAIFRLPFHTLGFNGTGWSFIRSIATFEDKQFLVEDFKTWRANYITHCYGEYFVGDVTTDDVGILSEIATDYGDDVSFGFDTFFKAPKESYFTAKSLNIDGLTGQVAEGEPERTIGLAISDDGYTYGPFFFSGLGETGDYRKEIFWEFPGGLGTYSDFMGIRIRTTAPVEISAEGLDVSV